MEIYWIFSAILIANLAVLLYKYLVFKDKPVFESEGVCVRINLTPEIRFQIELPKYIQADSVESIHVVGNRISLFNSCGNAYDLWVHKKHLSTVVEQAEAAFPQAKLVRPEAVENDFLIDEPVRA